MLAMGLVAMVILGVWGNAAAKSEPVTIEGNHGKLAAVLETPDKGDAYPIVILMHGFSANKKYKLFQIIADDLAKKGIASIRFDFNGHGESEGRFQDMTIPNEIEDAKKVYAYVKSLQGITSISLVGHSQGGVVAAMLAGELTQEYGDDAVKSLVLLAPAGNIVDKTIGGAFFGVQFDTDNMPDYIELPSGLHVGRDYFKTAYTLPLYDTAKLYQGPVTVIQGRNDTVVPYRYAQRFVNIYKQGNLELLDGYDHEFTQNMPAVARSVAETLERNINNSGGEVFNGHYYLQDFWTWVDKIIDWLEQAKVFLERLSESVGR